MLRAIAIGILCFGMCATLAGAKTTVTTQPFGKMPDGTQIEAYTLTDGSVEATIITYGGILVSLKTPDRNGNSADIVLGFDDLDGYVSNSNAAKGGAFFGALIGRYGNRIAKGRFTLDGKTYKLPINNAPNSLHGGTPASTIEFGRAKKSRRRRTDLRQPGRRSRLSRYAYRGRPLHARRRRTEDRLLRDHRQGHRRQSHQPLLLQSRRPGQRRHPRPHAHAASSKFTPVNAGLIPPANCAGQGTPFDFTKPTAIGERIDADDEQLKLGTATITTGLSTRRMEKSASRRS